MNDDASTRRPADATGVIDAMGRVRVIPVVTVKKADDAVGLVLALVEGGLPVVEITLRTPTAMESIHRAATQVPEAIVGAGSVTSAANAAAAIDAGAQFIISPGLDQGVVETAHDRGTPVIPGVATATELMRAVALGVNVVKLFPAELVGGSAMITALSALWPDMRFVPTGGISPANAAEYLALPQVLAVGGSWMASGSAIASRDWASITEVAAASVALVREAA
jgi:2-dehydro-3-deoxyphosphogluconate aldolase/(4S)-4-hydroxy-2-oxoglutarate aldolase